MLTFFSRVFFVTLFGAALLTGSNYLFRSLPSVAAAVIVFAIIFFFSYTSSLWVRLIFPSRRYMDEHRTNIDKLMRQCNLTLQEVYMHPGERTNAYVSGFAGLKSLTLTSHLIENYTWDEIRTLLLHEVAHLRSLDIVAYALVITLTLIAGGRLLPAVSYPLVAADAVVITLFLLPFFAALSRSRERRADSYAKRANPNREAGVTLCTKFQNEVTARAPFLISPPLIVRLFLTHPTSKERLTFFQS